MAWKGWENYAGTFDERQVTGEQAKRSKYGAEPTTVDGIRFDSKKEAARYSELKLMEKAGDIRDLVCQPKFPLYVYAFGNREQPVKVGAYVGDFAYTQKDGADAIEDVKGMKTPLYKWKKKHVEAQYGIEIREV